MATDNPSFKGDGEEPPKYSPYPPAMQQQQQYPYPPAPNVPYYPPPGPGLGYPPAPPVNPGAPQPIMVQPGQMVYVQPVERIPPTEVPDYLVLAVLVTIFCCWPIGIIAIFRSVRCRDARYRGNRTEAVAASNNAKQLSFVSIGCGIVLFTIVVVTQLFGAGVI